MARGILHPSFVPPPPPPMSTARYLPLFYSFYKFYNFILPLPPEYITTHRLYIECSSLDIQWMWLLYDLIGVQHCCSGYKTKYKLATRLPSFSSLPPPIFDGLQYTKANRESQEQVSTHYKWSKAGQWEGLGWGYIQTGGMHGWRDSVSKPRRFSDKLCTT